MTPEEYAKMHQKAFRTAFNYLNSHFPPGEDEAWWEQSARDLSAASIGDGENKLVIELLIAVQNYLGYEHQRRQEHGPED